MKAIPTVSVKGKDYNAEDYFEWLWEKHRREPWHDQEFARKFFHKGMDWASYKSEPLGLNPEFQEWLKRRRGGTETEHSAEWWKARYMQLEQTYEEDMRNRQ